MRRLITVALACSAALVAMVAVPAHSSAPGKLTAKNCPLMVNMGVLGLQNGPGSKFFRLEKPAKPTTPSSHERPFVLKVSKIRPGTKMCFGVWRSRRDTPTGKKIGPPHRFGFTVKGSTATSPVFNYPQTGAVDWTGYARRGRR